MGAFRMLSSTSFALCLTMAGGTNAETSHTSRNGQEGVIIGTDASNALLVLMIREIIQEEMHMVSYALVFLFGLITAMSFMVVMLANRLYSAAAEAGGSARTQQRAANAHTQQHQISAKEQAAAARCVGGGSEGASERGRSNRIPKSEARVSSQTASGISRTSSRGSSSSMQKGSCSPERDNRAGRRYLDTIDGSFASSNSMDTSSCNSPEMRGSQSPYRQPKHYQLAQGSSPESPTRHSSSTTSSPRRRERASEFAPSHHSRSREFAPSDSRSSRNASRNASSSRDDLVRSPRRARRKEEESAELLGGGGLLLHSPLKESRCASRNTSRRTSPETKVRGGVGSFKRTPSVTSVSSGINFDVRAIKAIQGTRASKNASPLRRSAHANFERTPSETY